MSSPWTKEEALKFLQKTAIPERPTNYKASYMFDLIGKPSWDNANTDQSDRVKSLLKFQKNASGMEKTALNIGQSVTKFGGPQCGMTERPGRLSAKNALATLSTPKSKTPVNASAKDESEIGTHPGGDALAQRSPADTQQTKVASVNPDKLQGLAYLFKAVDKYGAAADEVALGSDEGDDSNISFTLPTISTLTSEETPEQRKRKALADLGMDQNQIDRVMTATQVDKKGK